jgi:hypothetical protein
MPGFEFPQRSLESGDLGTQQAAALGRLVKGLS